MPVLLTIATLWVIFLSLAPNAIEQVFDQYQDIHMRAFALVSAFAVTVILLYLSIISLLVYVGEPPILRIF